VLVAQILGLGERRREDAGKQQREGGKGAGAAHVRLLDAAMRTARLSRPGAAAASDDTEKGERKDRDRRLAESPSGVAFADRPPQARRRGRRRPRTGVRRNSSKAFTRIRSPPPRRSPFRMASPKSRRVNCSISATVEAKSRTLFSSSSSA